LEAVEFKRQNRIELLEPRVDLTTEPAALT
jgi:hypothetical protein